MHYQIRTIFKTLQYFVFLLMIFSVFVSCNKDDEPDTVYVGYDYFPLQVGKTIHYDVDSTVWDDFTGETYSYHSQILEVIESTFIDQEHQEAFRLERYYRPNDTTAWVLKDVWYANIKPSSAEKVEENQRFVKLAFPIRDNIYWNGNALNDQGNETYEYDEIHTSNSAGTFLFDSTVTVIHSSSINLLEEDVRYEIYAAGVGMIVKYQRTITKNIATQEIESGIEVKYTIRNYIP